MWNPWWEDAIAHSQGNSMGKNNGTHADKGKPVEGQGWGVHH